MSDDINQVKCTLHYFITLDVMIYGEACEFPRCLWTHFFVVVGGGFVYIVKTISKIISYYKIWQKNKNSHFFFSFFTISYGGHFWPKTTSVTIFYDHLACSDHDLNFLLCVHIPNAIKEVSMCDWQWVLCADKIAQYERQRENHIVMF